MAAAGLAEHADAFFVVWELLKKDIIKNEDEIDGLAADMYRSCVA